MGILCAFLIIASFWSLKARWFLMQGIVEQKLRAHLGSFGITGNMALQPMFTLSGWLAGLVGREIRSVL